MKWRRFSSEESEEPLVNLTPLIDVVFVVLISFMIIAPILEVDSIALASGNTEKKTNAPPENAPLSILVRSDNTIWVQGKKCSLNELKTALIQQKKAYPGKNPQVIHDKNASFGTYQAVKNTLEQCGFEQMDLLLKPG